MQKIYRIKTLGKQPCCFLDEYWCMLKLWADVWHTNGPRETHWSIKTALTFTVYVLVKHQQRQSLHYKQVTQQLYFIKLTACKQDHSGSPESKIVWIKKKIAFCRSSPLVWQKMWSLPLGWCQTKDHVESHFKCTLSAPAAVCTCCWHAQSLHLASQMLSS